MVPSVAVGNPEPPTTPRRRRRHQAAPVGKDLEDFAGPVAFFHSPPEVRGQQVAVGFQEDLQVLGLQSEE